MSDAAPLLFIDTNIFLDFYRATGSADFRLLDRLKGIKESIITSHQIEMEFQKNRQARMSEAFDKLEFMRLPEIPGMFVGTSELDELSEAIKQVKEKLKILQNRLTGAVAIPGIVDSVYKVAKEVFSFESPFNLSRSKPEYPRMLRLARRRFMLGYPPRKEKDTSMGDAVNWEWIVECAMASKRPVIIVSRDSDYGLSFDKKRHLNEWLEQEFKERVGSKDASIRLTDSLSAALKEVKVRVTEAEEKAEEKLITYLPKHLGQLSEDEWKEIAKGVLGSLSTHWIPGSGLMRLNIPTSGTIPIYPPPAPISQPPSKGKKGTRKKGKK